MASQTHIAPKTTVPTIVRMAAPEFEQLRSIVFSRYPDREWASFVRFGWRETPNYLVLTLAEVEGPQIDDLDPSVAHVAIREPYTLRTALAAEGHPLAIGIVHSHPVGCMPSPSLIDDDMDSYYGGYFQDFAPSRPYVSLIFAEIDGEPAISGRVLWRNEWQYVVKFVVERTSIRTWVRGRISSGGEKPRERTARLNAAFGDEAASRLRMSSVAVIGAGGTGSAAIEILARAGVGRIIVVDPDFVDESNLERIHGSCPDDVRVRQAKVSLARRHVLSIDPSCDVAAYIGALPQKDIVDAIVSADIALGCTDQQHSRLALSDIAIRYLIPCLDCGVTIEGNEGLVSAQVLQIIRFLASDPCALCRGIVNPVRVAQELTSPQDRARRRAAAANAQKAGFDGSAYWRDTPQLNTVGYLTTMAGAMLAGYAVGWLTGRFDAPFERLQLNLTGKFLDVTDSVDVPRADCSCRQMRGKADQAADRALISSPSHWAAPQAI